MDERERGFLEPERYPQVVRFVAETPWAVLPSTLVAITDFVRLRAEGQRFSQEEIEARIGPSRAGAAEPRVSGGVAVLPLFGVISPRATLLSQISGGTSVESFRTAFRATLADPSVSAVVLDVHSPGGAVDLVPELAAELRAARGGKPIVAVADTLMASAAYWLASQADELVASPSSLVGSIGVLASHSDLSAAEERAGVKTTLISAGRFKAEANPFEPLSDEARAALQARVDDAYSLFVSDVAHGRGVSADSVRGGYGEGRALSARQALAAGLVDRVATLEDTVARVAAQPVAARRRSHASPFARAERALPALAAACSREEALYSMALLMGGRGGAAFAELADVDHRELYDRLAEAYQQHGLVPRAYARWPVYDNVAFRHDEREVFADRDLRTSLTNVTIGARRLRGPLSAETREAAQAAIRELETLGSGSTPNDREPVLEGILGELRRATQTLKGA